MLLFIILPYLCFETNVFYLYVFCGEKLACDLYCFSFLLDHWLSGVLSCMGPARPVCCAWLDWLARWSNRLAPVRSQIQVVYLILMSTSCCMTSRWFLFTYSSIPNVESCWEKKLCSDMVSCLFMIRCVLMPRKSIAGDGP